MNFKVWFENNDMNKTIIHSAFEKGIDKSDNSILGFHGTSIFTLMNAIKTGFLPITKGSEAYAGGGGIESTKAYGENFEKYGFHLVPNPKNKVIQKINFRKNLIQDPYKEAVNWANYLASRHSYFDKYNMDLDNPEHHAASHELEAGMKIGEKEIQKKYNLQKPKSNPIKSGVVLAISDSAANDFEVLMGGDGDDINIVTKSFPLKYIKGIDPVDDYAYEWLDQLT